MNKYLVTIRETSAKQVIINAEHLDEAVPAVDTLYADGTIPGITGDNYEGWETELEAELSDKDYRETLLPDGKSRYEEYYPKGYKPEKKRVERAKDAEKPISFDRHTENLIEISQIFACIVNANPDILELDIDSKDLKQEIVDWANEFEDMYPNPEYWGEHDYYEKIEEFSREKIMEYARSNRYGCALGA